MAARIDGTDKSAETKAMLIARFKEYLSQAGPVLAHLESLGLLRQVDAAGAVEEVYTATRRLFMPHKFVFVQGGPGAGKGTNCSQLAREFGLVHLSAGDLMRAEKNKPGSKDGALISSFIKEGKIVPASITIGLLKKAMEENAGGDVLD